ncbi:MAG: chemotaxis protein CheA [bacterium]|nr:chemotaxis protein CheA [bacterium]
MEIDEELFQAYMEDFDEQIQIMENDLVTLEKEGPSPDLISEIFRAAHTIKGSSAMVGFGLIETLSHSMESLLAGVRDGEIVIADPVVTGLFASVDFLRRLREQLPNLESSEERVVKLVTKLDALALSDGPSVADTEVDKALAAQLEVLGISETPTPDPPPVGRSPAVPKNGQMAVEIQLEALCLISAVRAAQILSILSEAGSVVDSDPTEKDIEEDRVGQTLRFILETAMDEDQVREVLLPVGDITQVEITAGSEPVEETASKLPVEKEEVAPPVGEKVPEDESAQPVQVQPDKKAPPPVTKAKRIKISVERLNSLMNLVGELVIYRTRLEQLVKTLEIRFEKDDDIISLSLTSGQIANLSNNLKNQIIKARLVPVANLFQRFPRVVRDVARRSGKTVDLVIRGEETELDRTVIEEIEDPLVHMLRNAVDHGIESPEERLAAGKNELGTVILSACHEEDRILIVIEDDGKGIDLEKLKARAVDVGVMSPEAAGRLSERDCLDLIFAPGFTTREVASEVSGRGVGMDIVRSNIERLSGNVFVTTKLGRGSRFVVRLPLTLAIIKVLLVSLAEHAYALPLISVEETIRISKHDIQLVKGTQTVFLRGEVLPLLRLRSVFGMEDPAFEESREQLVVVVVSWSDRKIGFVVDYPIGEHEIVIKPLGSYIGEVPGISGATILGDGRIALILDVASLIKSVIEETMY